MLSGILLTVGSIGAMMGAGAAVGAMYTWFHNFEYTPSKRSTRSSSSGGHRDRIDRLNDRVKPHDLM